MIVKKTPISSCIYLVYYKFGTLIIPNLGEHYTRWKKMWWNGVPELDQKLDGVAAFMTDPRQCNPTTMHSRMVRQKRHFCPGKPHYLPNLSLHCKSFLTSHAILKLSQIWKVLKKIEILSNIAFTLWGLMLFKDFLEKHF